MRARPPLVSALLAIVLAGCGEPAGSADTSSSTADASTGEPVPLTHGAITLEFLRAESQTSNPFVGARSSRSRSSTRTASWTSTTFVVETFAPAESTTDQAEPIMIRVAAVE